MKKISFWVRNFCAQLTDIKLIKKFAVLRAKLLCYIHIISEIHIFHFIICRLIFRFIRIIMPLAIFIYHLG